jgi:hypothetical protein
MDFTPITHLTNIEDGILVGILLLLATYVFPRLRQTVSARRERLAFDANITKINHSKQTRGTTVSLDSAFPNYIQENVSVNLTDKDQSFYIPCPEPYGDQLRLKSAGRIDCKTDFTLPRGVTFESLEAQTQVKDLRSRLLGHAEKVALDMLKRLASPEYAHKLFNGPQCAVKELSFSRVTGRDLRGNVEDSTLTCTFAETDYFTNLTLRSLYHELLHEENPPHPIASATPEEILSRYRFFLSSFGIDIFAIVGKSQRYMVFSKRSAHLPHMNGVSKWHLTMNEALTNQDFDAGKLDIFGCVSRGLKEENGVDASLATHLVVNPSFYSLFFVRPNFEVGLAGSVRLACSREEFDELRTASRDGAMEIEDYKFVQFDVHSIQTFVQEQYDKRNITDAAIFCARVVVARELGKPLLIRY